MPVADHWPPTEADRQRRVEYEAAMRSMTADGDNDWYRWERQVEDLTNLADAAMLQDPEGDA